jgi:nucleoside-diphosphate-sugar epimerase
VSGTILVTGATGFLGAALVDRLLARGHRKVRCLVRPGSDTSRLEAVVARHGGAGLELFAGSLSRDRAAAALEGVTLVHHLAARLGGAPADVFLGTVVASKHLCDAIVAAGHPIKVVLVSSFGVYGVAGLPERALLDESTPLEPHPERRDVYSHAKLRQEQVFREAAARQGFPLVVMRPGVIYGEGGAHLSARVGLPLMGAFLHLGGDNLLPLTYRDNCADALALAGERAETNGQTFNVVDDDLPTAGAYLRRYRREVRDLRVIPVPYPALAALSFAVERYHAWSKGQLPAVFTPYKTATSWKGMRFTNAKLKRLGWRPSVSMEEGMRRTFRALAASPA